MDKIDVVLVVLNKKFLNRAIQSLNLEKVNLETIIADGAGKNFQFEDKQFPVTSFANAARIMEKYQDFIWLIVSYEKGNADVLKIKKFLMLSDVKEENIVNFGLASKISPTWLANLRYIEENGADFFATGNKHTRDNLNLKYIPSVNADKNLAKGGVNLAYSNQDLSQSYLTAKYVFEHVEPNTIKLVLIGLTPDSFHRDNSKNFFGFQYIFSLAATAEKPDLNFNAVKKSIGNNFSVEAVINWEDEKKVLPTDFVEKNIQILKDYIELCLANGAKPVGVVLPFAPIARKNYDAEVLKTFRETIRSLEENYDFMCVDMFENLDYDSFGDMTHLNLGGSISIHSLFAMKLYERNLIPIESFLDMKYEYFRRLSWTAPKENYNPFMERVFKASAQNIRGKEKIKIGFVIYEVAQWSGDALYNLFANDERFETTIFLCLQVFMADNELVRKDFLHGVEQFKSHGLNVVALEERDAEVPEQDVLIYLTPYFNTLPISLRFLNMTPKTLTAYIPYSFDIALSVNSYYNFDIMRIAWKVFLSSAISLELYKENSTIDLPQGIFSGYPRMDIFFEKDKKFKFEWKMAQPDAKKIIWAPHWSIRGTSNVRYATFHWNYKFMYEFAKAHPETSWVVKPHQALFFSTVNEKIFPSVEAFKEYLQAWDDLPNAQVFTGTYYQEIFATSDAMIQDSGSFIAEYQFVNKPMIFLTRNGEVFNELGNEILKTSYLVDGRNFNAITEAIQKIIIEGNDDKAAERKEIFDKYLNYPEYNGMLASEFIYKNIGDEILER